MTTLVELKAQAYDALSQIEQWQLTLQNINKQIAEWKEPKVDEKKENKK